jgi:hypothetical protein
MLVFLSCLPAEWQLIRRDVIPTNKLQVHQYPPMQVAILLRRKKILSYKHLNVLKIALIQKTRVPTRQNFATKLMIRAI